MAALFPTRLPDARPRGPNRIFWILTAVACAGVAIYSARYLLHPPRTPAQALGNPLGAPWLVIHVAGGVTAVLLGSLQFLPGLRGLGGAHRWTGRLYALGCLTGGAAGLALAIGSSAGPIASAGFGSLAVLWIATTLLGGQAAMERRFEDHRRWMIRSWALTLAAVTLRVYLPLVLAMDWPVLPWYRAIAFLCWLPNLLVAEAYLRATPSPASAAGVRAPRPRRP